MRFVPFRFNSLSFPKVSNLFFMYDFSIKFNVYRFCDLPNFNFLFAATMLPEQSSKIACFSIFSELFFYQFQLSNSVGVNRQQTSQIFIIKQLDFSCFFSYLRFIFMYPDTRNLVSNPFSGTVNSFNFRIKDLSTLFNFFDFRLNYAHFYPTFYFFSNFFSSSHYSSQEIQGYVTSFFSSYMYKTNTIFGMD